MHLCSHLLFKNLKSEKNKYVFGKSMVICYLICSNSVYFHTYIFFNFARLTITIINIVAKNEEGDLLPTLLCNAYYLKVENLKRKKKKVGELLSLSGKL